MKKPITPLTALDGVYAAGIAAGVKKRGKKDLAYVYVPEAYGCAGVFTRNSFSAPPLIVSRAALKHGSVKAVVINSGNANAGTGSRGLRDAKEMAAQAAQLLKLPARGVAVASTGIIGKPLPMRIIRKGLNTLLRSPLVKDGDSAAQAIMTTDTTQKEVFCSAKIGGEVITVAGFAKGSGMIAPNMGTMLAFLATDARIDSGRLSALLRKATDASFNMTSVDTDTSTNDMALIFSTGKRGRAITSAQHTREFLDLLTLACCQLARKIAADGEGATKLIEATVRGARSLKQARVIAKNIINSPLVKTAIHGADPNWGRVLAAAGKCPTAHMDPRKVDLTFAGIQVMRRGEVVAHQRSRVHHKMLAKEVKIDLNLNLGTASTTAWGCDLTHAYVDINIEYN